MHCCAQLVCKPRGFEECNVVALFTEEDCCAETADTSTAYCDVERPRFCRRVVAIESVCSSACNAHDGYDGRNAIVVAKDEDGKSTYQRECGVCKAEYEMLPAIYLLCHLSCATIRPVVDWL